MILLASLTSKAQNVIDWSETYKLQLSDFQAATTQIGNVNMYSLHSSAMMDFSFYMSNYEFMFTKNFNAKVSCKFTRDAASLIAPDNETAEALLDFAQYEFDLQEMYARRFRKKCLKRKELFRV